MKLRISKDAIFEVLGEETVILNVTDGSYFSLNGSASVAWRLIEEKGDLEAVREGMLDRYDHDARVIADDLNSLIDSLQERGLIETDPT